MGGKKSLASHSAKPKKTGSYFSYFFLLLYNGRMGGIYIAARERTLLYPLLSRTRGVYSLPPILPFWLFLS